MILSLVAACTFVTDEEWAGREETCDKSGLYVDSDADGWGSTPAETCADVAQSVNRVGDCDDADATVYPMATDIPYDGVDSDCAGDGDYDLDGDGYQAVEGGGDDCWDDASQPPPSLEGDCEEATIGILAPADVNPGATDEPYDGVDANCSGGSDFDGDGDAYPACEDCDDTDASRYPSDVEEVWYNGYDENCDGNDGDQDGDGYVVENYAYEIPEDQLPGDCWDDGSDRPEEMESLNGYPQLASTEVHAFASDTWYDGIDQDCNGDDDFDQDGDDDPTSEYPQRDGSYGGDCDDLDDTVSSLAEETWYDDFDQDCKGDDDFDQDGDGDPSSDWGGDDCDDRDPGISSLAEEDCGSSADEDCDGNDNDEDAVGCTAYYADADGDGHGGSSSACLCVPTAAYPEGLSTDCDDGSATVSPDGVEDCATSADDDCDGDENDLDALACTNWYRDADYDGYGASAYVCACEGVGVYSATTATDCDDGDASVYDTLTWYADADSDGYGDPSASTGACAAPGGYVDNASDCDDTTSSANPAATETCADSIDNDCDGSANDEDAAACSTYWADLDGDGYTGTSACLCWAEGDYAYGGDSGDCDDGSSSASPGSGEVCMDGIDGGCDERPGGCGVSGTVDLGVLQHQWVGPDLGFGAHVGAPGDTDGDGNEEMLVGADDSRGGSAYLLAYARTPGTVEADATLEVVAGSSTDELGHALGSVGDVDGDGRTDFLVGAPGAGGTGEGGVFLGGQSGRAVLANASAYLLGDNAGDEAFRSGGYLGDPDGDGVKGLAVGVPGYDSGGTDAGALLVIDSLSLSSSATVGSVATSTWRGESAGDQAGRQLLSGRDLSGDGLGDIVVGAPGADRSTADGGAVYVIYAPFAGSSSLAAADLRIGGTLAGGGLGGDALAVGEFTGDGRNDLLVGSTAYDAGGTGAGSVFLLDGGATGDIDTSSYWLRLDAGSGDALGAALACGDFDNDGREDIAAAAPGYDGSSTDAGLVAVFLGPFGSTTYGLGTAEAFYTGADTGDGAASSLAALGDLDGDGTADFAVGVPLAEGGAGVSYLLRGGGY